MSRRLSRAAAAADASSSLDVDPFAFEPSSSPSPPPPTRTRGSAAGGDGASGRRSAGAASASGAAADAAARSKSAAAASSTSAAIAAPSSSRGRRSSAASSSVVSDAYKADRARLEQQALMAAQARSLQQMIQRGDIHTRTSTTNTAAKTKPATTKQTPADHNSSNKRGRSATRSAAAAAAAVAAASSDDDADPSSSESEADFAPTRPKAKRSLMASLASPHKASGKKKKKKDDDDSDAETQPPRKRTRRAASPSLTSSSSSENEQEDELTPPRRGRPSRAVKSGASASGSKSKTPAGAQGRKRATILDEPEEEEQEKDDVCLICQDGGILIVCEQCVQAYHQGCLEERHPDNYEFLKELGEDDPLTCRDVHQTCTTRTETRKVQKWDEMEYAREADANDVRMRAKWVGAVTHRAGRKKFYRAFQRDIDVYSIGSHVLLQAPSSPDMPSYLVAEIESLWEDMDTHEKMVECRWLYLPEETRTGRLAHHGADEIFETGHCDDNEVAAIEDLCDVVDHEEYERRIAEDEERGLGEADRANARKLFFVRQRYDDDRGEFRPVVRGRAGRTGAAQKERAVNPRQSLVSLGGPSAPSKPRGAKAQSIYSQACAQLQLSAAPPKLPCRDKERADIMRFIENALKRGTADGGLYIAGVPGTGKTATVVRVISELAARSDLPAFEYVEINGMKLPEPHQLYTALWKSLTGKHAAPAKAAVYLDQRFRTANPRRPICVLLVDELDFIMTRQQNVIYNLFDWPGRKTARLIVLGISNTIDLPDMLMPRVHSRLGLTKLHFEPYTTDQIREIISDRLRALPAFGEGAVELCARKIASISGDIRRALQICRRAAEICEEDQLRITAMEKAAARKSSKSAASSASASPPLIIGESHIVRAISDLQNSSFIQWLRVRAPRLPLEPVLLCAMLACIKFASGPSRPGSAVMAAGGDENPVVPLDALASQAATLMDVKGVRKLVADRSGVRVELMPLPSMADWSRLVQQWGDLKLVQLAYTRGERFPAVQLNVLVEDIEHAYRGDDMWDRLRSQ